MPKRESYSPKLFEPIAVARNPLPRAGRRRHHHRCPLARARGQRDRLTLALRRHQRESSQSPFVFVSERGAPLTAPGFSRMVERAAVAADLGIKAHARILRHACGYKLANDGVDTRWLQAYLGHRNIQNTTRYTALAPDRFKGFWKD
jgi:site-specific recombinase XerD